jgi:hypothetical protein
MIVVKELAAKLQIQLATKLINALADMFRLTAEVQFIIESDLSHDDCLTCEKFNTHYFT